MTNPSKAKAAEPAKDDEREVVSQTAEDGSSREPRRTDTGEIGSRATGTASAEKEGGSTPEDGRESSDRWSEVIGQL